MKTLPDHLIQTIHLQIFILYYIGWRITEKMEFFTSEFVIRSYPEKEQLEIFHVMNGSSLQILHKKLK